MQYRRKRRFFITRRGLLYSLALGLLIMGFGGVGFWILEPRVQTLGDGLWLAFTTAATVGYGDMVPSTHASRAFAVVVVLLGLAILSLVTASVAAMFVETEERQIERDLMREIGALRKEVQALHRDLQARSVDSLESPAQNGPA
nr:potassium channel family protein [uncultured Albidiferax sp.]